MKVAVITAYHKEPIEKLRRCHESVVRQTHSDVMHFMVADGYPLDEVYTWDRCIHIVLPLSHNDAGDTPRLIGSASAAAQMYQAISFLDADNWLAPNHIETLINLQIQTQSHIVTCTRFLCRPDTGDVLGVCRESNGIQFTDTNCYLFSHTAFPLLAAWGLRDNHTISKGWGMMGDRILWNNVINSRAKRVHSPHPTVYYETSFAVHYAAYGHPIPNFTKVIISLPPDHKISIVPYHEYRILVEKGVIPYIGF